MSSKEGAVAGRQVKSVGPPASNLSVWGDDGDEQGAGGGTGEFSRPRPTNTTVNRFSVPRAPGNMAVSNMDMDTNDSGIAGGAATKALAWGDDGDEELTAFEKLAWASLHTPPASATTNPEPQKRAAVVHGGVSSSAANSDAEGGTGKGNPPFQEQSNSSSMPETAQQQQSRRAPVSWGEDGDEDDDDDEDIAKDGGGSRYCAMPLLSRSFGEGAVARAGRILSSALPPPAPAGEARPLPAATAQSRYGDNIRQKNNNDEKADNDDREAIGASVMQSPSNRFSPGDREPLSPEGLALWADEDGYNANTNSDDAADGFGGASGASCQSCDVKDDRYAVLTSCPSPAQGGRQHSIRTVAEDTPIAYLGRRGLAPALTVDDLDGQKIAQNAPSSAVFDESALWPPGVVLASTYLPRDGLTRGELTPATTAGLPWPDNNTSRGDRFFPRIRESSPLHNEAATGYVGSVSPLRVPIYRHLLSVEHERSRRPFPRRFWFARGKQASRGGRGEDTTKNDNGLSPIRKAFLQNHSDDSGGRVSGVRTWKWWDNLRKAPGFVARFCACVLAVCALWMTSLSVAASVGNNALQSPTINEVVSAVAHAYHTVQEQREQYEMCVDRQSAFCDADIEAFSVTARAETVEKLASTALTYELASEVTASCNASLQTSQVSLKTWLAQGTGHVMLYSGECDKEDEALVADLVGDVSDTRENLASTISGFASDSIATVAALSSYALERSAYDQSYAANKSEVVFVLAEGLFENVTDAFPAAIDVSFANLAAYADTLVSCVSMRGDDTENPDTNCPHESVRTLLDEARAELDAQLVDAREGFQDYVDAFEEYETLATEAHDNMIIFYQGAMSLLQREGVSINGLAWADLTAADFYIQSVNLPSISGVLTGYADVLTAAEIWDRMAAAYTDFQDSLERAGDNISTLAEAWDAAATEILSNISVTFSLDDYDPPHYAGASTPDDSNAAIAATAAEFNTSARLFGTAELALLDALGPRAANRSLPASLSLNHTFQIDESTAVFSSSIRFSYAAFSGTAVDFGFWTVSTGALGALLIAADYIFRCTKSIRLFIRFWGRAGLGLPDADLRADKPVVGWGGGIVAGMRYGAIRVILHPGTTLTFFTVVTGFLVYYVAVIYLPLYYDYQAGCVEHTQPGSFFTQNMYTIAYNYAAAEGTRDTWEYQDDHTTRQATLCGELTASVREYLIETDLLLRQLYETHGADVTKTGFLQTCLDLDGMDALYEEACCGQDGYGSCLANSTLKCPMNYSMGVGQAYGPVGVELSNDNCGKETLDKANWKVEDDIELDCGTIPACTMTCAGPNEELIRAVTMHAGCTLEWYIHAGWLKGVTIFVMYLFMNASRAVLVVAIIKINWRRMHTGIFTYKGTCTRAGELVMKELDRKAKKGRQKAAAKTAEARKPKTKSDKRGKSFSPVHLPARGITSGQAGQKDKEKMPVGGGGDHRMAGGGVGRAGAGWGEDGAGGRGGKSMDPPGPLKKQHGQMWKIGLGSRYDSVSKVLPPDSPKQQQQRQQKSQPLPEADDDASEPSRPLVLKEVIAGALEDDLERYEAGAWREVLLGVLLNLPWIAMLWYASSGNVEYIRL